MRKLIDLQQKLFGSDISEIEFDLKSRDEIPKLLIGLQHIYSNPEIRNEIFKILEEIIPADTDKTNGRPGMNLWKILVLGTLRLNCNWDYDKLKEIADNHKNVRRMLQHDLEDETTYPLQTIKDNLALFTPEILDRINQVVVKAGHKIEGKEAEEGLKGQCDSFVVETDVHFPTDISLLFDALRTMIALIVALCVNAGITSWRQHRKNLIKIKRLFNACRKLRRSTSKSAKKKEEREEEIRQVHQDYIDVASEYVEKAKMTVVELQLGGYSNEAAIAEIEKFISHAERQIDQIERRVIHDENIPHAEKVFSVFEEHTEWISKGKAGVPQELGVKVCIVKDQFGYILHHRVMQNETDEKITVSITAETKDRYPDLKSCSYDKGFYAPGNSENLKPILDVVILPKKGKLNAEESAVETSEDFIQGRKKHPAVESAINALENHGLDRCPDHGIKGFKRYVALSVLARNIQILGHTIQRKKLKSEKRKEKYRQTWDENRKAA